MLYNSILTVNLTNNITSYIDYKFKNKDLKKVMYRFMKLYFQYVEARKL